MSRAAFSLPLMEARVARAVDPLSRPHPGLRVAGAVPTDAHLPGRGEARKVAAALRVSAAAYGAALDELGTGAKERLVIHEADHAARVDALERAADVPQPALLAHDRRLGDLAEELAARGDLLDHAAAAWERCLREEHDLIARHVQRRVDSARTRAVTALAEATTSAAALQSERAIAEALGVGVPPTDIPEQVRQLAAAS